MIYHNGGIMMLENGTDICNCKKKKCERFGKCNECIEYHKNSKRLPYCKREKVKVIDKLFHKNNI